MGPPYKNYYSYFRADANAFIRQNKTWTVDERNRTISTIWAGDANIVEYYTTRTRHAGGRWRRDSPGLPNPNPIPAVPFTAADVNHAKTTHTMPLAAAAPGPATGAHLPSVVAVPAYVDSRLHNFWPRLPWSTEPDLAPLDIDGMKKDVSFLNAWLDTEPYMPLLSDTSQRHGIKLLGFGSYGAAGLWVEADAANNICDRMVIKEAKPLTARHWRDPKNWRDRLPHEIRIHKLLEERRAVDLTMCHYIIRCRAHRLWITSRRYRLYLDFHAGGDLNGAMKRCADNWKVRRPTDESVFLPEGFVWYVIKALATACLVLQDGTTSDVPVDGWRPITHLDLHLPNVLLDVSAGDKVEDADDADADRAKVPPVVPILADFGISFFSPQSDDCPNLENPDDYIIDGVDTRYPPEMHQQTPPYTLQLGEKTDVWGIGNIAWSLLGNKQADYNGPILCNHHSYSLLYDDFGGRVPLAFECELTFPSYDESNVLAEDSAIQFTSENYGQEIKALVRKCLDWGQAKRPTLREIIAEADQYLSDDTVWTEKVMDMDRLQLSLPDDSDFAIGQPVEEAKRKGRYRD